MSRSKHTRTSDSLRFEEHFLDIDHWPQGWQVEPRDLRVGERLLEIFKPFLYELLGQRLSPKTLHRHRNHLGELGGEIIRRIHLQPQLRRRDMLPVLLALLDDEGGPLVYPYGTEPDQRAFDSTCRKLRQFLVATGPPSS